MARLPAAAVRADLDALYAGLRSAHYDLFAHTPRADYDRAYARLRAALTGPRSRPEAVKLFMQLAGVGRVGHARVDFPGAAYEAYVSGGGVGFPLELRFQDGRAFIAADHAGAPRLVAGTELVTLDGEPITAWVARLGRYISAEHPALTHAALKAWPGFARLLWLDRGPVAAFRLGVPARRPPRRGAAGRGPRGRPLGGRRARGRAPGRVGTRRTTCLAPGCLTGFVTFAARP